MTAASSRSLDVRRDVDAACDLVCTHLGMGHFVPIEAEVLGSAERRLATELTESEPGNLRAGTKPLSILTDAEGRTYVLKKVHEAPLIAAEEAAWELLRLGNRPGVPARRALVTVRDPAGEIADVEGLLKPYVDLSARAELPPDSSQWTPLQRAVMLASHVWEHFLDNLDTNTSQYALLGPDDVPVNIDWDRAFATEGKSELTRFSKHKTILPNARNFMYADYIEGKIKLPLEVLTREANRIRHLPRADVKLILERYARARYGEDEAAAGEFVERMLERRHRLERDVARFIVDLRMERARMRAPASTWPERLWRWATLVWDRWQLALHRAFRSPLGSFARGVLKRLRARPA